MKVQNVPAFPFFQKTVINFRLLLQKGREAPIVSALTKTAATFIIK